MRPVDADLLRRWVWESMNENPHKDSRIHANHEHEHLHFLKLIDELPTIQYHIDEIEGHYE